MFTGSHDEWSPLQEVIVGIPGHARIPVRDKGQACIEFGGVSPNCPPPGPMPEQVIEETEEDLAELVRVFEQLGVIVRRPRVIDHSKRFGTFDWESDGFNTFCPRDSLLVVGERIIEVPMALRCRYVEQLAFKEILLDYFEQGAQWLSAPKPTLRDETYDASAAEGSVLTNVEPIFDAANILRAGADLFYLISNTGNEQGWRWLSRVLGSAYNVHPCRGLYSGVHIDSTISLIRPGLALLNPARVNGRNLPEPLQQWDTIWCPELVDTGYIGGHAYSSVWVGMNLLMVNPHLAIVDNRQTNLIRHLARHGVDAISVRLRHSRTLGGGFHCVVLDTKRAGGYEQYFHNSRTVR